MSVDSITLVSVALIGTLIAAFVLGVYVYERRNPELRDALRCREELRAQKEREELEARAAAEAESAKQSEEWANTNPRTHSLVRFIGFVVFAVGAFWLAPEMKGSWQATVFWLAGAGSALAAAFYFLGILFTPEGAGKLLFWLVIGGIAIWVIGSALESTTGAIVLGFVVVIWVILKGIEEIKKEIRARDERRGY